MMRNKVMYGAELRWAPRMYFKSIFQYLFPIFLFSYIIFMATWDVVAKNLEKPEERLHHVALQLPWLHQFQFAGYYAAAEKGFYRDAGFQVNIIEGKPGLSPVDEVVSDRVNYGVARSEILLHRLHGNPVVVLAAIMQHSAIIFLTKKETDINSPQDMIGHRVMMLKGDDAAEYIAMFHSEGVSLEQIKVIPSNFDINDLIEGKVDVFNAYSTNEPYYLEAKNIPTTIIRPINYGIDFYGDCLFTSERELKRNPDQVKAFREASLRGWQYAMAHPEEIINIILNKYGVKKTREHLSFEANALRELILPDIIQIGHMNPGRWHHMANTYVELGMADSDYSLKGFIYDPNPKPDYTWIRWAFGVTVFLCLLIGLSAIVLFLFNRRLQVEVRQRKQAQQTIIESEQKTKQYLDVAGVIILALDTDGNISLINERGLKVLGYRREELLGKNWFTTCLPDRLRGEFVAVYRQLMRGEIKPVEYHENQIQRKDGEERIIAWHNATLRNSSGEITGTLSSGEDITERKKAEVELRLKNLVFETAITANSTADNKGILTHVNHAFIRTWGYENKEEAVGKPISEFLKFEDEAKKIITALNKAGKWEGEYTALKKDGTTFVAYGLATTIEDEPGNVIGYQSAVLDISEQKLAEEALRESKERYRALFDRSLEFVYLCDFEGNFIDANDTALEGLGCTKKDIKPLNFTSLLDKDQLPRALEAVEEILKTGSQKEVVEYKLRRRDGEYIYVETKGALIYREGKPFAIQGIARNITDRKLAEDALRESEEKYRSIFENAVEGFFQSTPEGRFTSVNPSFASMLGYASPEELISNISDIAEQYYVNPEDRRNYMQLLEKDGSVEHFEFRARCKDGSQIWVSNSTRAIYDRDGKIARYEGNVKNITLRKQAEEALRESEEKYRSMMNAMKDPVYICSPDYIVEYMNPAMIRKLGRDATGEKCFKAIHDFDEICTWCMHSKIVRNECYEYDIVRPKDNHSYHVSNSPIVHEDGSTSTMTVFRDTTDFIKIEEQFRQAQKMEAIGTLAGGIAHDFNNLLTTIIGNAQLALMDISKDDSLREQIEEIKKAGQRSASLTRQLLAFSRKQVIKPEVLDLNEVINETEKILKRIIGEDIELQTILKSELWKVHMDSGQIDQIIINMVVNSRDAMPQGGKLIIETANVDLDENYFREHGIDKTPGSYVMLAISDTGSGMNKETQEHIFEPFFTTKEIGKGTGLGLSTVYGIAKQNNGFIWVYSEPGQGSTFKVYLPMVEGNVEAEKKERTSVAELGGSETVLIVEDDDSLRKLAGTVLKQRGYKVLEAENGEDALRVSEAHDGSIDLLITDVVMPKMGGKEIAERLQPLYPQMKVIYMSGYTDNAIVHHGVLAPGLNFLEKPFTPEGLALKVREVLDDLK